MDEGAEGRGGTEGGGLEEASRGHATCGICFEVFAESDLRPASCERHLFCDTCWEGTAFLQEDRVSLQPGKEEARLDAAGIRALEAEPRAILAGQAVQGDPLSCSFSGLAGSDPDTCCGATHACAHVPKICMAYAGYITTVVADGPGCLSMRCPDPDCEAAVPESFVRTLAPEATWSKYKRYLLRSYVDDNRNVSWEHAYVPTGC